MLNDIEWLVLAGGQGTRSANPSLPKILQAVEDTTILELLLDSMTSTGCQKVTFVLKHGIEQVVSHLEKSNTDLDWAIHEDPGAGPVQALKSAASKVKARHIGCILGDTAMDAPLDWFFTEHIESGASASIVVRQSTHLSDSDTFVLTHDGRTAGFKGKSDKESAFIGQLWGASGILFLETNLALSLPRQGSDVASSIVAGIGAQEVNCIRSSFYHKDSGTSGRLDAIRHDRKSGLLGSRSQKHSSRRALFIDRDGTLVPDLPEGRTELVAEDINAKVLSTIELAKETGVPVFLVTNQPAIAKGFLSIADVYKVHNELQSVLKSLAGVVLDDIAFCPHHPDLGFPGENLAYKMQCECRKPSPGMVEELCRVHNVDPERSAIIGDSYADEGVAKALNMTFFHVDNYSNAQLTNIWERV